MHSHPLTAYRKANDVSLGALAARLGVDKATVWRWERSRVPAEKLLKVEQITGVPREKLRPDLYEVA